MSDEPKPAAGGTPRRAFLRALAIAPAIAAGCATTRATSPEDPAAAPAAPAASAAAPPMDDALAPLRAFALAADAEPAFVFRAAVARPQE
jgi:hypothetical protein